VQDLVDRKTCSYLRENGEINRCEQVQNKLCPETFHGTYCCPNQFEFMFNAMKLKGVNILQWGFQSFGHHDHSCFEVWSKIQ